MVSSEADEASASPDIFRTMRRRSPTVASVADDDLGELRDRGRSEQLGDGLLLVLDVGLVEQDPLLVPAVEAPLADLGQRGIWLAFVAGDLLHGLEGGVAAPWIFPPLIGAERNANRIGSIDDQCLANKVFDLTVNMGPAALKLLQSTVQCAKDGVLGPISITQINARDPVELLAQYKELAARRYTQIAAGNPQLAGDLTGWLSRLNS